MPRPTIFINGKPFGGWFQPIAVGPDRFHDHINERQATMPTTTEPQDAAGVEAEILKHMTLEVAADRQADYENAAQAASIASGRRDRAIVALLQHGFTSPQIGEALGLTAGRVRQIAARMGWRARP